MTKKDLNNLLVGDKLRRPMDSLPPIKLTAYYGGYWMARRPKAVPFVISDKEILEDWIIIKS